MNRATYHAWMATFRLLKAILHVWQARVEQQWQETASKASTPNSEDQ